MLVSNKTGAPSRGREVQGLAEVLKKLAAFNWSEGTNPVYLAGPLTGANFTLG